MTNASYERLYAVGDILRHIRTIEHLLKTAGHLDTRPTRQDTDRPHRT